jgi:hypothetical protein
MKAFNEKDKVRQLFHEFEQYDKLHLKFVLDFENSIYNFIADHPKNIKLSVSFPEDLKLFCNSLINCAYEVLEKNETYPEYRMQIELKNMDKLLRHSPQPFGNEIFSKDFSQMAKAKMPTYFPQLFDLSSDGFRLLQRCTNYRINVFLLYLYAK